MNASTAPSVASMRQIRATKLSVRHAKSRGVTNVKYGFRLRPNYATQADWRITRDARELGLAEQLAPCLQHRARRPSCWQQHNDEIESAYDTCR